MYLSKRDIVFPPMADAKVCASELARAWEKVEPIRRKAQNLQLARAPRLRTCASCAEVTSVGKVLTRESLKSNSQVIELAVKYLGLRVSVPCCQIHVAALYELMSINCPSNLAVKRSSLLLARRRG